MNFVRTTTLQACKKCQNIPKAALSTKGFIGPPDPVSNLRKYKYDLPSNASPLEVRLHSERQAVQQWNDNFWRAHNTDFIKQKEEFVKRQGVENGETSLNADQMSVFYKRFLDDNWKKHVVYNFTWYKKNAGLVLLHLKVKMFSFLPRK